MCALINVLHEGGIFFLTNAQITFQRREKPCSNTRVHVEMKCGSEHERVDAGQDEDDNRIEGYETTCDVRVARTRRCERIQ